jgi:hypothetical protein
MYLFLMGELSVTIVGVTSTLISVLLYVIWRTIHELWIEERARK